MPVQIKTVLELRGLHPEAAVKALRPANKAAMQDAIKYWHGAFLPKHFQASAVQRYNYAARNPRYNRRKRRATGEARPLVWSGALERNTTTQIRVSGTANRARGRMSGTQALNFSGRSGMPPMRDELLRTTRGEQRELVRFHEKRITQALKRATSGASERRQLS